MTLVTQLNEEILKDGPRKDIRSGLTSAFVPGNVRNHTAAASLDPTECFDGFVHTNEGAAGAVVLSLPSAIIGMNVKFLVRAAQNLDINPQDTEQIEDLTNAAGDAARAAVVGATLNLVCVEDGLWLVTEKSQAVGTGVEHWTDVN